MDRIQLTILSLLLLLVSTFSAQAQQSVDLKGLSAKIDHYLQEGVQNAFSGAILVSVKDEIIINKGYGLADKNTNRLNTPHTIFDIGSNTKQFTGAAMLMLVEQGKLSVTDALSEFFEDLPDDKQDITIHQLLTHSAGLVETIGRDFEEISQEEYFNKLFASELLFEPGASYSYSNTGYSILARIIEMVSGQSYEAFLNEQLFQPAGMTQTGYLLPNWINDHMARGYYRNFLDAGTMISRYQEANSVNLHLKGNGGINSTQNEMSLWMKALKSNKILSQNLFNQFTSPYVSSPDGKFSYAYGWVVKKTEDGSLRLSHNGANGIFAHSIVWYPNEDMYIIYSTNASSPKVEYIAYQVEKMLLDPDFVPKPIQNNVYAYILKYLDTKPVGKSKELLSILQEEYKSEFTNAAVLNRIGYHVLRSNGDTDWALELFKMNVSLYPDKGSLWDSLGDAYQAKKSKAEAIESYRKAIDLGYVDSQKKIDELMKE